MAVGPEQFPPMHGVAGVRLGTASAGIKKPGRKDLVVMALAPQSSVAGVFTRNAFCAAPVQVAKEYLAMDATRYLVINTGNANAGTGAEGIANARRVCAALAQMEGVSASAVLPFSTGVIGEQLPVEPILSALPDACAALTEDGWRAAALGIMTTDTRPKGASTALLIAGQPVTVTGIAKGAGMIKPDMATMLGFIATDAQVAPALLQQVLERAAAKSFNRITIDGDTSTNDALMLLATGQGAARIDAHNLAAFQQAVEDVCVQLAQAIVRDGEGATKFVTVTVESGATPAECLAVAYTIAESPLVKTALFASDPNWGRILAAIGRAGVVDLAVDQVRVWLDDVLIAELGGRAASYTEAAGQAVMDRDELTIRVELQRGACLETVWTSDLSHEYIRVNAEYRS